MKLARLLGLAAALFTMSSGAATAVVEPIAFFLDGVSIVGGAFPTSQTYTPGFSLVGSGSIDTATGLGTVTLPNYSIFIDINLDGDDVRLDIDNWSQTITAVDGSGNVTSTGGGTTSCTVLGGLGGFVCPTVLPTVAGWPPADGASLTSSAVIDLGLRKLVVTDNSNAAGGTITQFYAWSVVPEPNTALLLGSSLAGLGMLNRRRRS